MKTFLIILNTILAAVVVFGTAGNLRRVLAQKPDTALEVKKKDRSAVKKSAPEPVQSKEEPSREEMIKKITESNLFFNGRSPNAGVRGNRRVTLTLVGTFTIGKVSGAIIKHNIQQDNRFNAFGMFRRNAFGGPMGGPMGGGMGGGPMGQRNVNMGGQGGGRRGNFGNSGNLSGSGGGSSRMRFGAGAGGPMPPQGFMPGMFTGMNQAQSTSAQTYRQYVRVGETLSNGYTLVEVTRTGAVLTRGGDKMELEIQDASKGLPSGRSVANRKQTPQQILQQGMQQMQNILVQQGMQQNFMMRQMMNQNNGGNQNQRGTPAARRR